jgi:hypothetical protein
MSQPLEINGEVLTKREIVYRINHLIDEKHLTKTIVINLLKAYKLDHTKYNQLRMDNSGISIKAVDLLYFLKILEKFKK